MADAFDDQVEDPFAEFFEEPEPDYGVRMHVIAPNFPAPDAAESNWLSPEHPFWNLSHCYLGSRAVIRDPVC